VSTPIPTPAQPDPEPGIDWDALEEAFHADFEAKQPPAIIMARDEIQELVEQADQAPPELTERIVKLIRQRTPETETVPAEEIDDEHVEEVVAEPVAAEDERTEVEPLGFGLICATAGVVAAVLALAGLGFIISFDTQTAALAPFFGGKAWMVPLGIDVGIVAFAALNLVLARINISMPWVRAVPGVLTAMTLYINVTAYDDLIARVAHVALPGLWIVASEVGTHVVKVRAGLAAGTRTESLGLARWLLSPITTVRLWRHMRLWGVKTAAKAREVESQRLEAKAALRYTYGPFWRLSAPVQLLTSYRLCKLTAKEVYDWEAPQTTNDKPTNDKPAKDIETPAVVSKAVPAAPRPVRKAPAKPAAKPSPKTTAIRVDDAEAIKRLQALTPDANGHVSTKRARAELHCGSDRAKRLLAEAGLLAPEATTD
jgi:hypothetical protein